MCVSFEMYFQNKQGEYMRYYLSAIEVYFWSSEVELTYIVMLNLPYLPYQQFPHVIFIQNIRLNLHSRVYSHLILQF
jgi:hypothetical protein